METQTSTIDEKVIEKIQKLWTKAQSTKQLGNEHEAFAFMNKVNELLTIHNLSLLEIESHNKKSKSSVTHEENSLKLGKPHNGKFEFKLLQAITKFNYCRFLYFKPYGWHSKIITLIGEPHNIETVKFLFHMLSDKAQDFYNANWKDYPYKKFTSVGKFRRSYLSGFADGVYIALEQNQQKMMSENVKVTTLVKVEIEKVNMYMEENLSFRTVKPKKDSVSDIMAYKNGYIDGKHVTFEKPLEQSKEMQPIS